MHLICLSGELILPEYLLIITLYDEVCQRPTILDAVSVDDIKH
jgi:hypothetical protein